MPVSSPPKAPVRHIARGPRRGVVVSATAAVVALGPISTIVVWPGPAAAQSMYKCVGADNRITYQQKPCVGAGTSVDVTPATGTGGTTSQPETSPNAEKAAPKTSSPEVQPVAGPPATIPESALSRAKGRLDGRPKSGGGLTEHMSASAVIRQWGRPHQIDVVDRDLMFFDYCDYRLAAFWKGKLALWVLPFPESKAGAALYRYGEPWTSAPQKWGIDRERKTYMNSGVDRGDVQKWNAGRWIVTDTNGNIVSWCDTPTPQLSTPPPTSKSAWE